MPILEDLAGWRQQFEAGWLKTYQETGEMDWSLYKRPTNKNAPIGSAIDLSQSRLGLISSGGFYLAASQAPFDAENDLGDYTMRAFPSNTPFNDLAIAHTHYDHTAVLADSQVLLPLEHLQAMVAEGKIGRLAPSAISFSGYLPMAHRTVTELIPQIVDFVQSEAWDAAFLVPS